MQTQNKVMGIMTVVVLVLLSLVSKSLSQASRYDIMQFVVVWNPTYCETLTGSRHRCSTPIPQNFTIHGLWPADANGNGLSLPITSAEKQLAQLDMVLVEQDKALVDALRYVWLSAAPSKISREDFWTHEWSTHGFGLRNVIDVKAYFEAANTIHSTRVAINGKAGVKDYLAGNIQPGQVFYPQQLGNALTPLSTGIAIKCYFNGTHNFLQEVFLCLRKSDLKTFVPCPRSPGGVRLTQSCRENPGPFYLPA